MLLVVPYALLAHMQLQAHLHVLPVLSDTTKVPQVNPHAQEHTLVVLVKRQSQAPHHQQMVV